MRFDRLAEIAELFFANSRHATVESGAEDRVQARAPLGEQNVNEVGPPLEAAREGLRALQNLIFVGSRADRLKERVEGRIWILAPLLVNVGERHELLRLLVRIGHRVGAQAEQRGQIVPSLLGTEMGFHHGGPLIPSVEIRTLGPGPG